MSALDQRYGRTQKHHVRDRVLLIAGGVIVTLVVVAWVFWAGLDGTKPQVQATDIAHRLLPAERAVAVTWQVTLPSGNAAACIIQAQNDDHTIVGWRVIELPASDRPIRTFTERIRVAQPASTGFVDRCWLT